MMDIEDIESIVLDLQEKVSILENQVDELRGDIKFLERQIELNNE